MPEYFSPPQQTHGELDSVYDTFHKWGGTQWWAATHDGSGAKHELVYPAVAATAPLVGVPTGAVTFAQGGGVPEILGYSPVATFATNGVITFNPPLADPTQLSAGGTLIVCFTATALATSAMVQKSSETVLARNGYLLAFGASGELFFITSDNSSTQSTMISAAGTVVISERFVMIAEINGSNAEMWHNCTSVATSSVMQTPSNVANTLTIGNDQAVDRPATGQHEGFIALPGKFLTAADRAIVCSGFGIAV